MTFHLRPGNVGLGVVDTNQQFSTDPLGVEPVEQDSTTEADMKPTAGCRRKSESFPHNGASVPLSDYSG